jgi:hypothetical protein
MYKLIKTTSAKQQIVLRIFDNAYIPFDPDNTDYQQYLAWLEQGNTPEAAE